MKGGQVVELLAFIGGMVWVIGFTVGKVNGRITKSWWYILMPLAWLLIAILIIIVKNYILPRRDHHRHF